MDWTASGSRMLYRPEFRVYESREFCMTVGAKFQTGVFVFSDFD
jgi:hypothetical protein